MTRQSNQIQNQKIILVLDTSWLMEIGRYTFNPLTKMLEEKILNKGEDVEIWIHGRVLRELDGLKNVPDKSHQARIASRYLREALNAFKSRIKISDFGILEPKKEFKDSITSEVDAIILTLAEKARKKGKVYLFTTDNNMKLLGENKDFEVVDNLFNTLLQMDILDKSQEIIFLNTKNNIISDFFCFFVSFFKGFAIFLLALTMLVIIFSSGIVGIILSCIVVYYLYNLYKKYDKSIYTRPKYYNYNSSIENRNSECYKDDDWEEDDEENDFVSNPEYSCLSCNIFHDD